MSCSSIPYIIYKTTAECERLYFSDKYRMKMFYITIFEKNAHKLSGLSIIYFENSRRFSNNKKLKQNVQFRTKPC